MACALGIEALALREARPVRTGMGPARAERAMRETLRARAHAPSALVFAGLGASVVTGIRPGDVVIATEVRDDRGVVEAVTSTSIQAALKETGLTVHHGVLHSSDHVVRGPERVRLAESGVTCVDMETAAVCRAAPGVPVLSVRVVVDTPEYELVRPATLVHGVRALRALKQVGTVLATWHPNVSVD
ncbi:1-hydroxy-2-methyl-2-butenyl 4-diphosphate reductase [Streptacidiphilus pinicola]|nr:1-hydroxy-2-methyl-2-butenyl 4-diphosphate reductase [Streptacidiphilus pinicola]